MKNKQQIKLAKASTNKAVKAQKVKRMIALSGLVFGGLLMAGCAHQDLTAPCPNFGNSCTQTPINHWDTN